MKRWLIVLAIGCGSKPRPCAVIAEHAKSLVGLFGSAGDYPVDPRDVVRQVIATRCERDAWSSDARACVAQADSIEALRACGDAMQPQQSAALTADLDRLDRPVVAVAKREPAPAVGSGSVALVIEIRGEHQLEIAGRAVDDNELDQILHAAAARDPSTQVVLRAVRGVPHAAVVGVMERAKVAGLTRLAIATAGGQ